MHKYFATKLDKTCYQSRWLDISMARAVVKKCEDVSQIPLETSRQHIFCCLPQANAQITTWAILSDTSQLCLIFILEMLHTIVFRWSLIKYMPCKIQWRQHSIQTLEKQSYKGMFTSSFSADRWTKTLLGAFVLSSSSLIFFRPQIHLFINFRRARIHEKIFANLILRRPYLFGT
jgi:hypothetical protein